MAPIATYVFIDLETTGIPREENNKTKITELSMIVVKREHLLDTRPGSAPRVQHKLTLCFNPGRVMPSSVCKVTGLCNFLLEHEPSFNLQVYSLIKNFLTLFTKPVCLIAHNGFGFDFPILKSHFEKLNVSLSEDLLCADTYHGFYDILEARKLTKQPEDPQLSITGTSNTAQEVKENEENLKQIKKETSVDGVELLVTDTLPMKLRNETTPKQNPQVSVNTPRKEDRSRVSKARRRFPWSARSRPKESYKLKDIYERLLNRPAIDAHRAENDCILALECSAALNKEFVKWVDENHISFTEIKPMTIGVPLEP